MRTDATPFIVGQIRRVSFALHSAERRPPEHPLSTFQTVSLGSPVNKPACVRPATVGPTGERGAPTSANRGAGVGMGCSKEGPGSEVHGGCVPVVSQEAPAPPTSKREFLTR